jgi:hypothetical protein
MPAPPGVALEFSWSLRERVAAALTKPLDDLRKAIQQAASPPDLVDAADPAHFQRACMRGLAAVTDFGLDNGLPAPVRDALRKLPQHYQELLTMLLPATQALGAAAPDLRTIQSSEGMAGLLYQATQAANPTTPMGVAAIGGATLGTLFMPGIGTAIGGALGAWLGGMQSSRRDRRAIERFVAATKLMWAATEDLHNSLWNHIVHAVQQADGPRLPDSAFFDTAHAHWDGIKATIRPASVPGEPAPFLPAAAAYLRDWGPHPEALFVAGQACLPPYRLDIETLAQRVAQQIELYPADPSTHENDAHLALEQREFSRALDAAERGLTAAPLHSGLRAVRLEALAALGRVAEAEEAVRQIRTAAPTATPELALIRGLLRGGRRDEAAGSVAAWVKRDGKPALVLQQLKSLPLTAALVAPGAAPIAELSAVLPGQAGLLQAAVERHLRADGAKSYLGEPPGDMSRNAREAFLKLQTDETVLFFLDWSLWHNATTGLALTTHRLLWKGSWAAPVTLDLATAAEGPVTTEGAVLHVGAQSIDVENVQLAVSLAQVLREAGEILRPVGRSGQTVSLETPGTGATGA